MSVAFGAPIGGVLFSLEEVKKYSLLRHATETMDKCRCDGSFGLYAAFTRSFTKGCNSLHLLWLNILDFPLMLWMKLPIIYRIHLQSN